MEGAWSALHHGIDPRRVPVLHAWLRGDVVAGAAARRGTACRRSRSPCWARCSLLDAVLLAADLPWVALALVLLAVLCDGLDGAVALASERVSVRGAYADKIADRVADTAFAAVLWRCGAPWGLAVWPQAESLCCTRGSARFVGESCARGSRWPSVRRGRSARRSPAAARA